MPKSCRVPSETRRRFRWRWLLWLGLFCGGCFLAINIFLNSPFVRGRIEQKLHDKTGERWTVKAVNLTLRGDVRLYGIEAEIEEEELSVESVTLMPCYRRLLERELAVHRVEVVKPVCIVSDTWLWGKVHEYTEQADVKIETETPTVAQNDLKQSLLNSKTGSDTKVPSQPLPDAGKVAKHAPQVTPKQAPQHSPRLSEEVQDKGDDFEQWLHIKEATFVVKSKRGELGALRNLEAEIPLGGNNGIGEVQWEHVQILQQQLMPEGELSIQKEGGRLRFQHTEVNFLGVRLQVEIHLMRQGFRTFFYVDLTIPEQQQVQFFDDLEQVLDVSAKALAGRFYFGGELTRPMSWQAFADMRALGVTTRENHRSGSSYFDHFILQCALHQGVLQLPQMQLLGEDVSLMGNGMVAINGYGFGVLRVVASEEKAHWIDRVHQGAHLVDGVQWHIMRPMGNRDRYSMDIRYDGMIDEPMMKVENVSEWQPAFPALRRLLRFVKDEQREEFIISE